MIKMIAAVSKNGVIGKRSTNDLPWSKDKYLADMKWFRSSTANSTVIMGRSTFESMGSKPLPKRRNIIISRNKVNNVETYNSLEKAIHEANTFTLEERSQEDFINPDVWLIGGSNIYREGMKYADEIFLTLIPEEVSGDDLVYFPFVNPNVFEIAVKVKLPESDLEVVQYTSIM